MLKIENIDLFDLDYWHHENPQISILEKLTCLFLTFSKMIYTAITNSHSQSATRVQIVQIMREILACNIIV